MPRKQQKQEQFMPALTNFFRLFFAHGSNKRKGIPSQLAQLHIRSQPDLVRRSQPGQIGHSPAGSYVARQVQVTKQSGLQPVA